MRPDDYTLGQFAALDQPPWQAPPQRLEEWPGAERPSATNWMMGETAALGDYIPTPPSNILGDIATSMVDYAKRPGQTMAPNPYPPGSEEAQFYEDQRKSNTYRIGPEAGFDIVTGGMGIAPKGALGMAGGRIKQPTIAPGALAAVDEYRPPFYSAVEQAVQGAKQNAAPGQQWAGFLRNQPGVKQEEVEALKLGKLFEQPGSVPKQAVLGEIAANRVNVGEVIKGGKSYDDFVNRYVSEGYPRGIAEEMASDAMTSGQGEATKFHQYTLPGGENYREMLLTLPQKGREQGAVAADFARQMREKYGEQWSAKLAPQESAQYDALISTQEKAEAGSIFKSSHYDEPNILAHVRYNDRVIDGKKTLFVEEVQSDWHQKGKRSGYRTEPDKEMVGNVVPQEGNLWKVEWQDGSYSGGYHSEAAAQEAAQRRAVLKNQDAVPDAPFKTTWPELAMKRIIREAAEKGYDKVAWTPGSVQAERYDLSKHLDNVIVQKTENGFYNLKAVDKQGKTVLSDVYDAQKLPDVIGKDLAEKIVRDTEPQKNKSRPVAKYEGLDLKVGGEGMKGFYDEILPATVNRLVKKHGGRVGEGAIDPSSTWRVVYSGPRDYRIFDDATGSYAVGYENTGWHTKKDAERTIGYAKENAKKVHSLDITPQLRAQAMKGFPLFTAGGVAATGVISDLARQDEYR